MRYISLFCFILKRNIKIRMSYNIDFMLSFIFNLISNIYTLVFIEIIFLNIPLLGGWGLYEVLMIYGLNMICRGVFETFCGELDLLGSDYILDAKLDNILLRPVSSLFLLLTNNFYDENLTEVFLGIITLIISFINTGAFLHISNYLILLISIINGIILYFSFFLCISSTTFWFQTRFSLMWTFLDLTNFSGYPLNIFNSAIKFILTWIIPFGLVTYYPAILLLNKSTESSMIVYFSPIITIIFLFLSITTWKKGLSRYESIGN